MSNGHHMHQQKLNAEYLIITLQTLFLQAYGSQLVRKVRYRHVLARSYFSRIPDMAEQMKGKVQELPLPRPKEREIMARVRTDTHQQNSLDQQQQQIVAA